MDALDRKIILATQEGLPLVPQPYHTLAEPLGITPGEVISRMQAMLDSGVIRRIGVVPNHYSLGYKANGMTVWDLADDRVDEMGERIGQLDYVSHCYHRPRHLPDWPYNFFAMVHGYDRAEVEQQARQIAEILGDACRARDILYSTRILKKTGLRLA
ncbi:MAG: AsnC family transcriptional regulator [Sulfuricellaceae bacterium]|nr:AsnC family transcriptional regulator [Sulfuricellaceae bacterium]